MSKRATKPVIRVPVAPQPVGGSGSGTGRAPRYKVPTATSGRKGVSSAAHAKSTKKR